MRWFKSHLTDEPSELNDFRLIDIQHRPGSARFLIRKSKAALALIQSPTNKQLEIT